MFFNIEGGLKKYLIHFPSCPHTPSNVLMVLALKVTSHTLTITYDAPFCQQFRLSGIYLLCV